MRCLLNNCLLAWWRYCWQQTKQFPPVTKSKLDGDLQRLRVEENMEAGTGTAEAKESEAKEAEYRFHETSSASEHPWDLHVYTAFSQRSPDWVGGGKTAAEMEKEMRLRFASGSFRKLVVPQATWASVVKALPQAVRDKLVKKPAWLSPGATAGPPLRYRRIVGQPPNHNLSILVEGCS